MLGFLAVVLVIAGVLSGYASGHPDGLEFVAESTGFLATARDSATAAGPLADYGVSGIENARLSTGLAGVIGALITLVLAAVLTRALGRRASSGSRV